MAGLSRCRRPTTIYKCIQLAAGAGVNHRFANKKNVQQMLKLIKYVNVLYGIGLDMSPACPGVWDSWWWVPLDA